VASVNSALQRARATLAASDLSSKPAPVDPEQQALLDHYVDAFERFDVDALVQLLHQDVVQTMPPYVLWIRGADEIGRWLRGPGAKCEGSRLLPVEVNGCRGFGQYRPDGNGGHAPWSLVVIETADGRITGLHNFLDTNLFAYFGLPEHL
jgi:RNA polymerase sigma-70 factor (ECF subfamily)